MKSPSARSSGDQPGPAVTTSRKAVLLPVHSNTFFVELNRVGALLQRSERYEPVFLFAWPYPTRLRDLRECLRQGFRCLDERGNPLLSPEALAGFGAAPSHGKIAGVAQALTRPLVGDTLHFLDYHHRRRRLARSILIREACALLVMAGDIVGYDTAAFISAAHSVGIPVALVPSTMSNGTEQAEVYFHNRDYHVRGVPNRLAALLFPRWARIHRGRRLLRRPAGDVFAMESLGIAPSLPWIFNSGAADVLATESDAMADYYVAGGLPRSKLAMVGSLANDVLADGCARAAAAKARLHVQLGLSPGRPMVLSALPPDFLYVEGGRPECDFRTYEELVRFWVDTLLLIRGYNVVLSLHPSVAPESMKSLETDVLKIGPPNTAELIPLCDLFVTSVSSTIRWAIACGKPVVNYDVYRYRYTDFAGVPGVLALEEQADFLATVGRLTGEPEFYRSVAAAQEACASSWGRLDGKAGSRMLELFDSLTGQSLGGPLPYTAA